MYEDDDDFQMAAETGEGPRRRRARIVVLHEDESLIVFSKPAGIWLDMSPTDLPCVVEQLHEAKLIDEADGVAFAYPLDPAVSGVMVLGRTAAFAANLEKQAAEGDLTLKCDALVRGPVMQDEGRLELNLAFTGQEGNGKMKIDGAGKPSSIEWRVADRFVGFARLTVKPRPALPHQIRMLLEASGVPLAVDPVYGGATNLMLSSFKAGYRRSRRHEERPLLDRVSLHVASVSLRHPGRGEMVRFECPMPKDYRAARHQLERFGRLPR